MFVCIHITNRVLNISLVRCFCPDNISLICEIKKVVTETSSITSSQHGFQKNFFFFKKTKEKTNFKMNVDKKMDEILKSLNKIEEKIFKIESKTNKVNERIDIFEADFVSKCKKLMIL